MEDERREVFRGHFDECLAHFANEVASQTEKGAKGSSKPKKPMAEFCKVGVFQVSNWLGGKHRPVGEAQLRVMFYLDLVGYTVIELEPNHMPKYLRHFAELIVFDVLPAQEAFQVVGYSHVYCLWKIFQGKRGTTRQTEETIAQQYRLRKLELEKRIQEARLKYCSPVSQRPVPFKEEPAAAQRRTFNKEGPIIIMSGLLKLLKENHFSESELANLSAQDAQTIGQLSVAMSSLASKLIQRDRRKEHADGG